MDHEDLKDPLLKEYEIGNELTRVYFKGQWTATSIFIPICFGLIAASFSTTEILKLTGLQLIPMAGASILIFLYGWAYGNRYTGYCKSIWCRLRKIEGEKDMQLHKMINEHDKKRCLKWRMKHINIIVLFVLLFLWVFRILIAPLILS